MTGRSSGGGWLGKRMAPQPRTMIWGPYHGAAAYNVKLVRNY